MVTHGNFLKDLFGSKISTELIQGYADSLTENNKIPFIILEEDIVDDLYVFDSTGMGISIAEIFQEIDYPFKRGVFFYTSKYEINYSKKTWIIFTQDGLIFEDLNSRDTVFFSWDSWENVVLSKQQNLDVPAIFLTNPTTKDIGEICISPIPDLNKNIEKGQEVDQNNKSITKIEYDEITLSEVNFAYQILNRFWKIVDENRNSDINNIPLDIFTWIYKDDFRVFEEECEEDEIDDSEDEIHLDEYEIYFEEGKEKVEAKDYQGAIEAFDKALEINPSSAIAYQKRGQVKCDLVDFQGAIDDFNKAILIDKDWWGFYFYRGNAKKSLKDYKGAIDDYDRVIEMNPASEEAYHNSAISKSEIKDYQGAIHDYNKVIDIDSSWWAYYLGRGNAKKSIEDFHGAIEDFTKVIELKPDYKTAYQNRGNAKSELKDYKGAIEDFSKAISIDENWWGYYWNRGNAKNSLKDFQGAIEDFTKVIELKPDYKWAYQNRGTAKSELKDFEGAINDFNKVIELEPDNRWNYWKRAEIKRELNEFNDAIIDYDKAIEIDSNYDWAHYGRGLTNISLKDYSSAIVDFSKVIEISPNWVNAHFNLGLAKHNLTDFDGAINNYEFAISKNTYDINIYYNRELAKSKMDSYKGEIENLDKGSIDNNYINAYYNRAIDYMQNKNLHNAIEDFNLVIKLNPSYAEAYYNRADPRYDLEDYKGAIEDYTKVIELKPNYKNAFCSRGITKGKINDYEGAIEDLSKAIEIDANYRWAYQSRAYIKVSLKNYQEAIKDYDEAIEIEPDYDFLYYKRAESKREIKDYEGAIEDLNRAIAIDSDYEDYYMSRGKLKSEIKDFTGAIEDFSKAIAVDGNNWEYYLNRGNTKNNIEDYNGALQDFSKLIELNPSYWEAYEKRQIIKELLGDLEGANLEKSLIILGQTDNSDDRASLIRENVNYLKNKHTNNTEVVKYAVLSNAYLDEDELELFFQDKDEIFRACIAKNAISISKRISSLLSEDKSFLVKTSLLANPKCSIEIIEKIANDYLNYTSSKIRKVAAQHINAPKELIDKLLNDNYRWVREAAATHSSIEDSEISSLIPKADRYTLKGLLSNANCSKENKDLINNLLIDEDKYPIELNTYKLLNKRTTILEHVAGAVKIEDVVAAIESDESWYDSVGQEYYIYDNLWQNYGPTDLVDEILFPDGTIEKINLKINFKEDDNLFKKYKNLGDQPFFQTAEAYEKGSWEWNEFELEYDFNIDCLDVDSEDEKLITEYLYSNAETGEYELINGELIESSTFSIIITLYANTKEGIKEVDFEELEINSNAENIKAILIKKLNLVNLDDDVKESGDKETLEIKKGNNEEENNYSDSGSSQQNETENSVTKSGNVILYSDFDTWIAEIRNGQKEDKSQKIKERKPLEISKDAEAVAKRFFDELNLKCNEDDLLSFKFSPTGGCTVYFKNRKVAGLNIFKKNIIELMILRDYNKKYYRPLIENLDISNIREEQISYQVPWGYAFYRILNEPKLINENFDILFSFIQDGITTIKFDRILSLKAKEFRKLKPIFDGTFEV